VTLASVALLALVFGLLVYDWATLGRGRLARRMLALEALVFLGGAFFIAFPDAATAAAHKVGIGRGVDFILYPLVIWLVRESLLNRRRRWEDAERLTQLVRAQALADARALDPPSAEGDPRLERRA
jgi:hypothetical protein